MPPWTIVLSSAIAAIVVTAALAIPEVVNASRSEIGTALLPHLPALAVAALGVYGLVAMSLTTTGLVAGMLRIRNHLARAVLAPARARQDWIAMLGPNWFRRQLVAGAGQTGAETATDDATYPVTLAVDEVRSEITRRHYISLARSHFFSVLIVLIGIVGLGIAQDRGALPFQTGVIPTVAAILIVAGLLLLALLGRIAIDVTAEPLLETIAQPPAEQIELGLLRRIVALLEAARDRVAADDRISEYPVQFAEQLASTFERGHRALLDAVSRLSASNQALETAMRSSVEAIGTTMRSTAAQQRPVDDDRDAITAAIPELQAAVEELTAVLRRLSAGPEYAEETTFPGDAVPSGGKPPAPGLARELRRLLQEIDAAR